LQKKEIAYMHTKAYNVPEWGYKTMPIKKPTGRPRRVPKDEVVRIPLELSRGEDSAFRVAMSREYEGASRNYVLRKLIAEFCVSNKVPWPKEGKS
jgi:hypothetical protein